MLHETVVLVGDILVCRSEMVSARIKMNYIYQVTECHG